MSFLQYFLCNISTVGSILTQIVYYDGVEGTELFITTKVVLYQDWITREIHKRLRLHSETTTSTLTLSNLEKKLGLGISSIPRTMKPPEVLAMAHI
jgi:hypothetical protein